MKKLLFMPMLVQPSALSPEERQSFAEQKRPPLTFVALDIEADEINRLMSLCAMSESVGVNVVTTDVAVKGAFFVGDDEILEDLTQMISKELEAEELNNASPVWVDIFELPKDRKSIFENQSPLNIQFTYFGTVGECGFALASPEVGDVANSATVKPHILTRKAPDEVELLEPLKVLAASVGSNMLREGSGGDGNFDISGAIDVTEEGDFWVHGRVFVPRHLVDELATEEKANAGG